ncbi:MAG TPA: GNAT family N-acetyltransferase [Anaerolineales bacterium]|nr:GNAT family N-acetyltransferase [Anaerolineales bacterium]
MTSIRRLTHDDLPRLRQFWIEHWGGEEMVSRGNVYRPEHLQGFVIEDVNKWIGLLTFFIENDECEITSLNSLQERQGIGTSLINELVEEARKQSCKRVFFITTNDNLNALGFYQKRGFELVALYPSAVNESRKIKPGIPLIGYNNIPLRDEIELEMKL